MKRAAPSELATDDPAALLASASLEISSDGHQLPELRDIFEPGRDVSITHLPGEEYHHNIATAAALRRAGFIPVPHVAVREMRSREMLDDFLGRVHGEADATRILLVAGDCARPQGPYRDTRDACDSGLIEAHNFERVSFAGYPEGHPQVDEDEALALLAAHRDWGRRVGINVDIVTQFCFEATPLLAFMRKLETRGIDCPVTIGLAGPATPRTLMNFALRCGIGRSMRSLRDHIGRYGRLLKETGPDQVVDGIRHAPSDARRALQGFHFFPLGGLRQTKGWIDGYL